MRLFFKRIVTKGKQIYLTV